jgi:hypothetical protein
MSLSILLMLGVLWAGSFVAAAQGQEQAIIRVLVTSEKKGTPLPGVNVVLLQPSEKGKGNIQYAGVTDSDGFTEFRNVTPRTYRLRISFVGYETYETVLTPEGGKRRVEHVALAVEMQQLDEVRVEEERDVATGEMGVRTVTGAEIDRIPTPGPSGDLATYLWTLPGITMIGSRGGNLYVRGGTPMQNQILVDNMSVIKPFHISNLFSAFPSEIVQSVDTYAGGFGADYMGATSAVIDVKLRPGNMKQYSASGAVSPYLVSLQAEGAHRSGPAVLQPDGATIRD